MSHKRNSKIVTPKDEWGTPQWLFDLLDQEFHFHCDAAAAEDNTKCQLYMGAPYADALNQPIWCGYEPGADADYTVNRFFLNPPYSAGNIDKFMAKAYEESQKGALVVCLVPCATDTRWWHNYAMKAQEIRFISGSGDKRGHGKTPLFMAGMKCLPLCKVPLLPTIHCNDEHYEIEH